MRYCLGIVLLLPFAAQALERDPNVRSNKKPPSFVAQWVDQIVTEEKRIAVCMADSGAKNFLSISAALYGVGSAALVNRALETNSGNTYAMAFCCAVVAAEHARLWYFAKKTEESPEKKIVKGLS